MAIGNITQQDAIEYSKRWVEQEVGKGKPVETAIDEAITTLHPHMPVTLSSADIADWREKLRHFARPFVPAAAVNIPVHLHITVSVSVSVVPTVTVEGVTSSPVVVSSSPVPSSSVPSLSPARAVEALPPPSGVSKTFTTSGTDFNALLDDVLGNMFHDTK